jgi:hypothetical protein
MNGEIKKNRKTVIREKEYNKGEGAEYKENRTGNQRERTGECKGIVS